MTELGSTLRQIVLAGIGAIVIGVEKSEELIDKLVKKGELTSKKGKALNEELKHNINERIKKTEVISKVDVESMSHEERMEVLKKIRDLEERQ